MKYPRTMKMRTEFEVGEFEVVDEKVATSTWLKGRRIRLIKTPSPNIIINPFMTHSIRWLKTEGVVEKGGLWVYIRTGSYEKMRVDFDRLTKVIK